jgi:hypothetical protein
MKINDKSKQYFSQNIANPRGCREREREREREYSL